MFLHKQFDGYEFGDAMQRVVGSFLLYKSKLVEVRDTQRPELVVLDKDSKEYRIKIDEAEQIYTEYGYVAVGKDVYHLSRAPVRTNFHGVHSGAVVVYTAAGKTFKLGSLNTDMRFALVEALLADKRNKVKDVIGGGVINKEVAIVGGKLFCNRAEIGYVSDGKVHTCNVDVLRNIMKVCNESS